MTGRQESAGRVDMSRRVDLDCWLIRSDPMRGTGPEAIGARVDEHVGWRPGSISFRVARALVGLVGKAGAERLALNGWR